MGSSNHFYPIDGLRLNQIGVLWWIVQRYAGPQWSSKSIISPLSLLGASALEVVPVADAILPAPGTTSTSH